MSYYLTISIFPFLIAVYAILSSLNLPANFIGSGKIIPPVCFGCSEYCAMRRTVGDAHCGRHDDAELLFVRRQLAYEHHGGYPGQPASGASVQCFCRHLGGSAGHHIFPLLLSYPENGCLTFWRNNSVCALEIWQWVRFVILFFALLTIIYLIYKVSAPKETVRSEAAGSDSSLPSSAGGQHGVSGLVGSAASYPIIYGSLMSFIILMLSIYICSIVLIIRMFHFTVYHKNPAVRVRET